MSTTPSDLGFPKQRFGRALLRDPCAFCCGPSEALDHIVPRSLGGEDAWTNFAGICRSCNSSKGTKSLLGFLIYHTHLRREIVEIESRLRQLRGYAQVGRPA